MKNHYNADLEKGFLPILGTKVQVIGTRFHGFKGVVVETPESWPKRAIAVLLNEWDEPVKLFRHNISTELEMILKA